MANAANDASTPSWCFTSHNNDSGAIALSDPRQRYRLLRRLGQSLFGELYLALDQCTDRSVAIKVSVTSLVKEGVSRNGVFVLEDPVCEAAIMQKLEPHPNVVRFLAVHESPGLHWLVQEFIDGCDLITLLMETGGLGENTAKAFFLNILSGLQHIHRSGVCHLDLSAENILVDQKGRLLICDFGVARRLPQEQKAFPACQQFAPGKLRYLAPELLAQKHYFGVSADLFSAGVVLFMMLAGQAPFEEASTANERFALIAAGKLDVLLAKLRLLDVVPSLAADLLQRLLHCSPDQRPASVEAVLAHPWLKR